MKVTGYQLREAIRRWSGVVDVTAKQFPDSIWGFDSDELDAKPKTIAAEYEEADLAIATLETAQQFYNQQIMVNVGGQRMTLSTAVKRVGGAGRLEKLWRNAATDSGRDRWSNRERTRSKDTEVATRSISAADCLAAARKASQFAGNLRAAIAMGNSKELEIEIDKNLVE